MIPDTKEPLVSIGLPVFNGEKYLPRALDSLLAQDYSHFELIISDNASTDNTSDISHAYMTKDDRIRYYRSEINYGAAWNFERTFRLANGEYFMWAAHDDVWLPSFISMLVDALQRHPDSSVAMSAVERIHADGTRHDIVKYSGKTDPSRMDYLNLALAIAAGRPYHLFIYGLYRLDFLKKAFDIPPVIAGDRLFICQMALATRFCYVDQILHVRQLGEHPIKIRYANEALGRIWQDPLSHWKKLLAIGPYLLKSKVIPMYRKLWVPVVVGKFLLYPSFYNLYAEIYGLVYYLAGRLLGVQQRDNLRRSLRRVLGKGTPD